MTCFRRAPDLIVEPVSHLWAAFSPLTGETSLLNDESAAILEALQDGPLTPDQIGKALASDSGLPFDDLMVTMSECWQNLTEAGFVQVVMVD